MNPLGGALDAGGSAETGYTMRGGRQCPNFWYMFGSIFAFKPSHSAIEMRRYLLRFIHLVPKRMLAGT